MRGLAAILGGLVVVGTAWGQDGPSGEVPPALAPFGHLVGAWKGQAIPQANRVRGWTERHLWAWAFEDGRPTGMALTFEGSKTLRAARLRYDAATRTYRLEGTDAAGKPVAFAGPIDAKGQVLRLDRTPAPPKGAGERLTLRLNSNRIRYTLLLETRAPGAPQYARAIDVNVGKEGESFASGGAEQALPQCVMTGGAATMSVSYNGKTYPVCCSGCRDEFLANPEKYAAKAARRAGAAATKGAAPEARPRPSGDDAFDGLVEDPPARKKGG
jgi:YHS domain-containing protein